MRSPRCPVARGGPGRGLCGVRSAAGGGRPARRRPRAAGASGSGGGPGPAPTLLEFAREHAAEPELPALVGQLQSAVKRIESSVAAAPLAGGRGGAAAEKVGGTNASGDEQKELDVVSNEIMKDALNASGCVSVLMSEEDEDCVVCEGATSGRFAVVFDPLDGSRNVEVSIPTGTIWGVYRSVDGDHRASVLQPGRQLVMAGYALFSSSCHVVVSFGKGTHGFTLDRERDTFVLTHPSMRVPDRGQLYSLNDARQVRRPYAPNVTHAADRARAPSARLA